MLQPFAPTPTGLCVAGVPSEDEWAACGALLGRSAGSLQWAVGDWILYGERKWGDTYTRALDLTGLNYQTLRNARYIAGKFDLSLRRDKLTFTHHGVVARLLPAEADALLDRAVLEGLSVRALAALVSARREPAPSAEPPDPDAQALWEARATAQRLTELLAALLSGPSADRLRVQLARHHADAALPALVAALADLAAGAAQGFHRDA